MHRAATAFQAAGVVLAATLSAAQAPAPLPSPATETAPVAAPEGFHFRAEAKLDARHSTFVQTPLFFPFPPSFIPPGETAVFQRTADPGYALELQNFALIGEGEISSGVAAKVELHVLDLYNRNPTSSDDRVFVREAWIRFGRRPDPLAAGRGAPLFVLAGMAPRFSKPVVRGLESYGLWGTAVGRFEVPQLQAGGDAGPVYWRAQVGKGNPLFFRDPNALAGDNGTPERAPGNVHTIYESGFPILYDAKPDDLDLHGKVEWGAGLGFKHVAPERSRGTDVDVLAWYFRRQLADSVVLRGTFYSGDIKLLQGVAFPLPFAGHTKWEAGVNLAARHGRWRLDGQLIRQEIATLPRQGFEAELGAVFDLHGLFLVGETPVGNWLRPVVRVSLIDNRFVTPKEFPGLSVGWNWRKYDFGVRMGLVRDVDLTLEYARNDVTTLGGIVHPDEALLTLRVGLRP